MCRYRLQLQFTAVALALLTSVHWETRAEDTFEATGAYTLVGQKADDPALEESTTGSLDLTLGWGRRWGRIDAYFEGNSSLRDRGVATLIPESNADAGTALDSDRSGRIQISELKYSRAWENEASLAAGLLDASVYLDTTRINNDENLQFLGAAFVNNPTIEFPDYTLGVAGHLRTADQRRTWNLVLASSQGIADNPNLSYSQVLNVTQGHDGFFAGAEVSRPRDLSLMRLGAWVNAASHDTLDGDETDASNYGLYSAIGVPRGRAAFNLRLGWANPEVSLAAGFAALSWQWDLGRQVVGVAAAHTWLSSRARFVNADDSVQLEAYFRWALKREIYLTPSIQYLINSDFHLSGTADTNVVVYSLRVHHVFFKHPSP